MFVNSLYKCSSAPLIIGLTSFSLVNKKFVKCENTVDIAKSDWVTPSYYKHYNQRSFDMNWDMRESRDSSKSEKKTVHTVLLIRHGQYHEVKGHDSARTLTSLGRYQAKAAGKRILELQKSKKIPKVKYVYHSTMTRAHETAEVILSELLDSDAESDSIKIEACSMLREGAVHRTDPPAPHYDPGEEKFTKDNLRVEAGFINHFHRADKDETDDYTTVLVCHGNVIRYFILRVLQLLPERWLSTAVYNCSISTINIFDSGKVSVRGVGDVGFLDPTKISYCESDGDGGIPDTRKGYVRKSKISVT